MADAFRVKQDVINEFRNTLYYNQHELQRLFKSDDQPHKAVVDRVRAILQENVVLNASIDLLEQYLPTPQPQQPQQEKPVSADDLGVKQID